MNTILKTAGIVCALLLAGQQTASAFKIEGLCTDDEFHAVGVTKVTLIKTDCKDCDEIVCITDDSSHFILDNIDEGTYNMTFEAEGFQKDSKEVTVSGKDYLFQMYLKPVKKETDASQTSK